MMKDNNYASMASLMASMAMMDGVAQVGRDKTPSPERKCLLPGCEKRTIHNGGYCCGEHCRQHRELRKSNTEVK